MKVFITGSTGLLGSTLLRLAPPKIKRGASFNVNLLVPNVVCDYHRVDITKPDLVERAFKRFKPEVVIHTAAQASPNYCDKHRREVVKVNVGGTRNMIAACKKYDAAFVFITTNGVYDGKKPPYDEKSIPRPIDTYGETKYQGEKMTQASGIPYIIIRLMTMYGWNNPNERQNPATWLIQLVGINKISVNLVTDMYNNFLFAEEASKAIWQAVEGGHFGETFNVAGKDSLDRYSFSNLIADEFGLDKKLITPVKMSFFKDFVARPKNTCFKTKKMEEFLKIRPLSAKKGLETMKKNKIDFEFWRKLG